MQKTDNMTTNTKYRQLKLAKEIGQAKAAKELGIPKNTLYGWVRANRLGNLDLGAGSQSPQSAMTLNEELLRLRQQVKELEKENRRLKKENDFLEEASAFFAREPSEVSKNERMKFIALKTKDGESKGDIAFLLQDPSCQQAGILPVSCEQRPPMEISAAGGCHAGDTLTEDECNDTYGRIRMYQALTLRQPGKRGDPQRAHRLPHHGRNRDQPSSQTQAERDHKSGQGSQKIRGSLKA